jgi:hypothetical protein
MCREEGDNNWPCETDTLFFSAMCFRSNQCNCGVGHKNNKVHIVIVPTTSTVPIICECFQ